MFKNFIKYIPYSLIKKFLRKEHIKNKYRNILKSHCKIENIKKIEQRQSNDHMSLKVEKILAEKFQSNILTQEKDFLILAKPQGTSTQGGNKQKTSINTWGKAWAKIYNQSNPLIVHRLDKETSGALLMALNRKAAKIFSNQFKLHTITKEYWALVTKIPKKNSGIINFPLQKYTTNHREKIIVNPQGKKAISYYKVLKKNLKFNIAWISIKPQTGRTHQLRIHCAEAGFPILGDPKYSKNISQSFNYQKRLHLHSYRIIFNDIQGRKKDFYSPLLNNISKTWKNLSFNKI